MVCKNTFDTLINNGIYMCTYRVIGLMRAENQGSIPGRVIPKTQKMVLDATLLNTQHYKLRIKGKMEQSKEWSSALLYTYYLLKRVLSVTLDYSCQL